MTITLYTTMYVAEAYVVGADTIPQVLEQSQPTQFQEAAWSACQGLARRHPEAKLRVVRFSKPINQHDKKG